MYIKVECNNNLVIPVNNENVNFIIDLLMKSYNVDCDYPDYEDQVSNKELKLSIIRSVKPAKEITDED